MYLHITDRTISVGLKVLDNAAAAERVQTLNDGGGIDKITFAQGTRQVAIQVGDGYAVVHVLGADHILPLASPNNHHTKK